MCIGQFLFSCCMFRFMSRTKRSFGATPGSFVRLGPLQPGTLSDSLRRRDQYPERLDGDSRQFHHPVRLH